MEHVEPLEAITLLLEKIGPAVRRAKREKLAATRGGGGDGAAMEAKLGALRGMIRANMSATVKALGSSAAQQIFERADADGNGVPSRDEATKLLMELQAASAGGEGGAVLATADEITAILAHVDIDGNGTISFVEFLIAFGLEEEPSPAAAPAAGLHKRASGTNIADAPCASEGALDGDSLESQIAQSISGRLYERIHALQRAFTYLDVEGHGWIAAKDFEHAISLVMEKIPPRPPPGTSHLQHGSPQPPSASAGEAEQLVSGGSIASLVASLADSSLSDGQSPPSIDYCGFVQAFVVRDMQGELF